MIYVCGVLSRRRRAAGPTLIFSSIYWFPALLEHLEFQGLSWTNGHVKFIWNLTNFTFALVECAGVRMSLSESVKPII